MINGIRMNPYNPFYSFTNHSNRIQKPQTNSYDFSIFGDTQKQMVDDECYTGEDRLASHVSISGSAHVKYDESSTEEDPVVYIWGKDSNGKPYESKVHLNDVDSYNATPAEMIALSAHLGKIGQNIPGSNMNTIGLLACGFDVNTKTNCVKFAETYIEMQKVCHNTSEVNVCQLQLERFIFFYQQNQQNQQNDFWLQDNEKNGAV